MTRHLSPGDVSRIISGETLDGETKRHLLECGECGAEIASLGVSLQAFRHSAHAWAEAAGSGTAAVRLPLAVEGTKAAPARRFLRAGPVFALAVLLTLVVWVVPHRPEQPTQKERPVAGISDAALLAQVDAGISRAVPETMEPLVSLVSWGNGSADGK